MKKIKYGLVGNGLLATHLAHYFSLEKLTFTKWSRDQDTISPYEKMKQCDIILLVISDDVIETFIRKNPLLKEKTLIHFSGALSIKGIIGFHPLMTFGQELYTLNKYRNIPFVGDLEKNSFITIFPQLINPYYKIDKDKKDLYHSLCVLGGNFTTILWQKVINDFVSELNLPKDIINPYIDQVCLNIKEDSKNALTGPIKRQDKNTMKKNIDALNGRPWKKLYKLFNRVYKWEKK